MYPTAETAAPALQHLVRRDPRTLGETRTRWTLAMLRQHAHWLRLRTDGGMQRLLRRCQISLQRARSSIHSPDPAYAVKVTNVQAVRMLARLAPDAAVVVYLDEVSLERQPTLAPAYAPQGGASQPRARRHCSSDTITRVVGALDQRTGRVIYRRASTITVAVLVQFFQDLRAAYPTATRIYVVLDNWPVHMHPDLLTALEPQESRHFRPLPRTWSTTPRASAVKRWGHLRLPIQLIPLPTYASWCNPIEKLWRKLRQEVTHVHPWAHDLPQLRKEIDQFLNQFVAGSQNLLQYVGLGVPD